MCARPASLTQVSIGRPIANTQIYLLDSHLYPVPLGVPGEMYISGDGLARGYLNRPELTAEKFIRNPLAINRVTSLQDWDLARYLPDGNIEFWGGLTPGERARIELGRSRRYCQHPWVRAQS